MDELYFFLFGSPRLEYRGQALKLARRKALALVTYLAMAQQPLSRDTLVVLFWPDLDQEHGRAALRSTLPDLNLVLPPGVLLADRMTITLDRDAAWIDVREFLSLLSQTRSHDHSSDVTCDECFPLLTNAVRLYAADFLDGFSLADSADYDDWQLMQREWFRRELATALRRLASYSADQRDVEMAMAYAQRWLNLDPLNEAPRRLLMRLNAAIGQKTEAMRIYEECVRLLDEELSTPPEEETHQLYEAIKASNSPSEGMISVERVTGAFPALPTLMVGRDGVLANLKQRLGVFGGTGEPVIAIQGWPGSGKSTTIAALAHDPDVVECFPDGVLWATLGPEPGLRAVLTSWTEALNMDTQQVRDIADISAQLTAALHSKRMLLILDDVWQAMHALPFKVGGHDCALVVTTRFNDVAQALAASPKGLYKLPLLTAEQSLQLLQTLAPEAVEQYPREAAELVNDLEGLPLALQVAGRLLHSEGQLGWGVDDLLTELREGASLLTAQVPADMVELDQNTTPTVATLLKRSTDSLEPETQQRFASLAFFAPKPATFDLSAMAVAWSVTDPKPTARLLTNRGLLEPVGGGRFQMHALLVMHAHALLHTT